MNGLTDEAGLQRTSRNRYTDKPAGIRTKEQTGRQEGRQKDEWMDRRGRNAEDKYKVRRADTHIDTDNIT